MSCDRLPPLPAPPRPLLGCCALLCGPARGPGRKLGRAALYYNQCRPGMVRGGWGGGGGWVEQWVTIGVEIQTTKASRIPSTPQPTPAHTCLETSSPFGWAPLHQFARWLTLDSGGLPRRSFKPNSREGKKNTARSFLHFLLHFFVLEAFLSAALWWCVQLALFLYFTGV